MNYKYLISALCLSLLISCSSDTDQILSVFEIDESVELKANTEVSLAVSLLDDNGDPIIGVDVSVASESGDIKLNEQVYKTSNSGRFEIDMTTGELFYSKLDLTFHGNDKYAPTSKVIEIKTIYDYSIPKPSSGLESDDLTTYDINSQRIFNMIDLIRENSTDFKYINSILIQQNDKLLLEAYFPYEERLNAGFFTGIDGYHLVASVSKSITSACIGIAVEKGYINSIDDSIVDYFPNRTIPNLVGKQAITIRNLLHMQSGLNCNDTGEWHNLSNDYVQYHLDLGLSSTPGTSFNYCTGVTMLLGAIIRNATGMDAQEFANKFIFEHLSMEFGDTGWTKDPSGNVMCGYNLWMHGRDMIKFGQLYLNGGARDGVQIVPENWVEASVETGPVQTYANRKAYGYQWWIGEHFVGGQTIKAYYAIGNGGNYIINIPQFNATIVLQGAEWNQNNIHLLVEVELMDKYILPALIN